MKIEVTQTMIDEGDVCSPRNCPVALGIVKATGIKDVRVLYNRVKIARKLKFLPNSVVRFIDVFDTGKLVRPFSFALDYP